MQPADAAAPQATAFSVLGALNQRVLNEFSEREPDGYWHPSSLFGCPRQAIYASRGTTITDPRDDRSRRVLRVGHTLHDFIQGAVNADPRVLAGFDEVAILDPVRKIKGSLDHVVFIWDGDEPMPEGLREGLTPALLWSLLAQEALRVEVVEYKTINSMAFKYRDLPKPDHVGQLSTYLSVLARFGGTAGDGTVIPPTQARGRIAYVSKDDLLVEEHTVLLTPGKEQEIDRRVVYLDRYAASDGALPPRLPDEIKQKTTQRAYLCRYCPYQRKCWDEDGPGVDLTGGNPVGTGP